MPSARLLLVPAAALLAGFAFDPPHKPLAAPEPVFRPELFFLGRSEGKGVINYALGRRGSLAEHSTGRIADDGTLILDQHVQRQGSSPERRLWRIRRQADGRYTGTLSDASGPVTGEVSGNCLRLRYRLKKGGMQVEHHVYLQPGGKAAINRMTVRRMGITFASVESTIRKVP